MPVEADLLASTVEVVFESLAYGLFTVLAVVSTVILTKKSQKTRHTFVLLGMIWTMLFVSTAHWCASLSYLVSQILGSAALEALSTICDAIAKVNYCIADAVLVWRAWILCNRWHRRITFALPLVSLGFTILLVVLTIAMRISINIRLAGTGSGGLAQMLRTLDFVQVGTLLFSTSTNVLSTSLFGAHLWNCRKSLRQVVCQPKHESTRSIRVLVLLLESGVLYTIFVLFSVFAACFRFSFGTIGDVTADTLIQVAGIYPTVIITLASIETSVTPSSTVSLAIDDMGGPFISAPTPSPQGSLASGPASLLQETQDKDTQSDVRSTLPALAFANFEYDITTYIHGVFGEPEDGMSGRPQAFE